MIKQTFLTQNDCFNDGRYFTPSGLMLHSVGCGYSSAQRFVDAYNRPNFDACVHGFIDSNTGDVYQTLPWNKRGWHAGGSANNTHIGVEMCESEFLTYVPKTAQFSIDIPNIKKAQAQLTLAYYSAVSLFAMLCNKFNLDPLKDGVVISHFEGGKRGVASDHVDPEHVWIGLSLPFTMNGFRKDVYNTMKKTPFVDVPENAYYEDAVKWAYENGIVKGIDNTHFEPETKISRADMVTILYRYKQLFNK